MVGQTHDVVVVTTPIIEWVPVIVHVYFSRYPRAEYGITGLPCYGQVTLLAPKYGASG